MPQYRVAAVGFARRLCQPTLRPRDHNMKHRLFITRLLALALCWFCCHPAFAKLGDPEATALKGRILEGGERADRAVEEIKEIFVRSDDDAYLCMQHLKKYWRPALQKQKREGDIAELAWMGVMSRPHDTKWVTDLLRWRIESLQREGRHEEALTEAVRLFNVCMLKDVDEALVLVNNELSATRSDGGSVGEQFRQEQARGVRQPGSKSPLMLGVDLASADLNWLLTKVSDEDDYRHKLGKGNVLLMLGRGEEAKAHFERQKGDKNLPGSVARAIKAIDGTIGRANQWAMDHPQE